MFKKNLTYCFSILSIFILLSLSKPTLAAMTFSLNHEMGAGTPVAIALERFGKPVEERSKGEMKVRVSHRGELGSEREMFSHMKVGSIEMGLSGSALIAAVTPEYGALDMPYLFENQGHLRKVASGPTGEALKKKILERQGIRVIAFIDRAPRHLTTKGDKIVRKPEDLKGIKIRIREIPVQVEAWRALGASPVPMAFGELYTALQTGTIDAQENPVEVTYNNSFFEVQNNLILTGHVREVQWIIASEKFWAKLNERQRGIILEAAAEAAKYGDQLTWEKETDFIKKMQDKGMRTIELTPEEKKAFMERVKGVPEKFKDKWVPGLYETIVKEGK